MINSKNFWIFILLSGLFSCESQRHQSLPFAPDEGILIFENFSGEPDSLGILFEIPLEIPAFSKGGYFSGDGGGQGFLPGNRNHLWLVDSNYTILNEPDYGENPPFYLLRSPAGTHGTFSVFQLENGEYLCLLPLAGSHSVSWIKFKAEQGPVLKTGTPGTARVEGAVPVIAWAKSDNLYEAGYRAWGKVLAGEVPGVLTDWRDNKKYPEMFNYLGWCTWEEFKRDINDSLLTSSVQKIKESIHAFYDQLFGSVKEAGFDFTKVDFQSTHLKFYSGEANAVNAHALTGRSMEELLHEKNLGLLNCIAQDMVSVLNTQYSSVTRCSQDYRMGNISNARIHIFQSYNNLLWMGHTVWGDHDMFHSSDTVNGRLMAVSKAISGGPVYLSDHPDDFIPEYVIYICYSDGEIIRPAAPALPLPESVFNNPLHEKVAYRVIAPQPNNAASVVCYNLFETDDKANLNDRHSADTESFMLYNETYRCMLPKKTNNLLVPVALSASRVGYSTIRMEPAWTALGEAAGMAAVVVLENDNTPENIDITDLQTRLHDVGAKTFYTADVMPGSPYFHAVQFFRQQRLFSAFIS